MAINTRRCVATLLLDASNIFINIGKCGTAAQGGYSTAIRTNERFVFPIPDGIKLEDAAPLMCGGLTVFSPLVRNGAGYASYVYTYRVDTEDIDLVLERRSA